MKILITGGAGFIGCNFVYYMLEKYPSYDIYCVDSLTYAGNILSLNKALQNKNFHFIKADITDRLKIDDLFNKVRFDCVVNFAAESHVDNSIKNPGIFLETNIIGTGVLLDACKKYNVSRFHQVSTDEVYGDLPLERTDLFFTEQSELKPSSPYSASKTSADLLVLAYHHTYSLPVTISRCSNNYGAYQFPEKLIPLIISKAMKNEALPVYGNGKNVRDWLYVKDHCAAIDLIIHFGKVGEVYNIGGHNERENIYVVKTILDFLKKPYSLIQYVEDRLGHDKRYAIDANKIISELNWQPTYTFETGLPITIQWYLTNSKWLESISNGDYLIHNKNIGAL